MNDVVETKTRQLSLHIIEVSYVTYIVFLTFIFIKMINEHT